MSWCDHLNLYIAASLRKKWKGFVGRGRNVLGEACFFFFFLVNVIFCLCVCVGGGLRIYMCKRICMCSHCVCSCMTAQSLVCVWRNSQRGNKHLFQNPCSFSRALAHIESNVTVGNVITTRTFIILTFSSHVSLHFSLWFLFLSSAV